MQRLKVDSSGSASLTHLFSTASGILFVLLFYNLVSYVGATGAVKEAARKTARCLTPTDPECVLVNSDSSPVDREWYGVSTPSNVSVDLNVRTFNYQASMPSTVWGASYDTFTTRVADQPFTISSHELPLRTFQAVSPHRIPSGNNQGTYSVWGPYQYAPKFIPNFPNFQLDRSPQAQAQIQRLIADSGMAEWEAWELVQGLDFQEWHFRKPNLDRDSSAVFETELIPVPDFPFGIEDRADCDHPLCDSKSYAGDTTPIGPSKSWRNFAYVAIKVFSIVKSSGGSTTVKWGESNNLPGLEIVTLDKNNMFTRFNPYVDEGYLPVSGDLRSVELRRCLGGVEEQDVNPANWTTYNMWLRGPVGANGGQSSSAICAGGNIKHDTIRVPRGGSFKVRARLANKGSNEAEAYVTILTYFDEFVDLDPPPKPLKCLPTPFNGNDEAGVCDIANCIPDCSNPNNFCPAPGQSLTEALEIARKPAEQISCAAEIIGGSYTCQESERTLPGSSVLMPENSPLTIKTAVCSDTWEPDFTAPQGERPTADFACGYQETPGSETVQVASAPASCSAARLVEEEFQCADSLLTTQNANEDNCPLAYQKLTQIADATGDINAAQASGAPQFGTQAQLSFGDKVNERDEFSWTPQGVFTKTSHELPENLGIEKPKRRSGSSDTPQAKEFIDAVLADSPGSSSDRGWNQYVSNPAPYVRVSSIKDKELKIDKVYPFNESAVEEIYYGQRDPGANWDFDADCSTDTTCDCIEAGNCGGDFQAFDNLEAMLRHYASSQVPEAADSAFVFNFEQPKHVGFKNIGEFGREGVARIDFPSCFPMRSTCRETRADDAKLEFIEVSATQPNVCSDGTYSECVSKIPEGDAPEPKDITTDIDLELARNKGLNELQDVYPFITLAAECKGAPGCAEIDIDTSTSPERANISITYNMPVIFPLSSIIGQDYIQITYTKSEVIERSFAGTDGGNTSTIFIP